ncbi:unnamed protein product [Cuscuta epithymum]|uniref:Photosystem II 5 kDa protein, chloroplastic n=1 Tax=Cuscuta epithymum TaxID=186058 RepID=A0AAV0DK42_9ASTE|nr:unnamed protein product [Cuscuta epithymum]
MAASMVTSPAYFGAAAAPSTLRRGVVTVKASCGGDKATAQESSGRRELVFGAAAMAAAAWSVTKVAEAEEPKPGTPEAKKKYAPICVTMPTARICRK